MATEIGYKEAIAILEDGDFKNLIGVIESDDIEAKAEPYQLAKDHIKQELAKDVVAFANSKRGIILLGAKTKRDDIHFGDEIEAIHPFEQKMINPTQYQDVLSRWVYPSLEKIDVRWFPMAGNKKKGIVAIIVPEQDNNRRPFLLTRTIDDSGRRMEIVFGYVERKIANASPMTVQELHGIIRDGMRFDSLNQKMDAIQGTIEILFQEKEGKISTQIYAKREEVLKEKIEVALGESKLAGKSAYVIAALPCFKVVPPKILLGRDSEVANLLEKPPQLRRSGFDLYTGNKTNIIRGQFRQTVSASGRKILQLWRDGELIFAAAGDREFLCWGNYQRDSQHFILNPLVLAESTYLFADLSLKLFNLMEPKPIEIIYKIQLRGMPVGDVSSGLVPFRIGTFGWEYKDTICSPPDKDAELSVTWDISDSKPGSLAYSILREIYMWFGVEPDRIPYAEKIDDHWEITRQQILSVSG